MTILNQNDSILMIIDVQERLLNAVYNLEMVERNTEILAKAASILNLPVFITEQYPKGLGTTVNNIKEAVQTAKYYEKTAFNALLEIDLLTELKKSSRKQVIICGIETHICVHQTAAGLIEQGFDVTVVKDACGCRFEESHVSGINCMQNNGSDIKTTEMVLFELLKTSKHPAFKDVQSLIK